jgi:hypothetical protein
LGEQVGGNAPPAPMTIPQMGRSTSAENPVCGVIYGVNCREMLSR